MTASFEAIEDLLRQDFGFKPEALGPHMAERAAVVRMAALGIASTIDYLALLRISVAEVQHLVEEVVNRETWFFREPRIFSDVVRAVHERLGENRKLSLLSLPCATGEEPYSLAMALLDSGLPALLFDIDGIDISRRAIETARAGVYDRVSFRGHDLAFRDRHFIPAGSRWQLSDAVRSAVRFVHADAMKGLDTGRRYDFIVCRNLLIYLTPEAAARLFEVLDTALAPGGCLVLSSSEASLVPEDRFKHLFDTSFGRRERPPADTSARPSSSRRPVTPPPAPPPDPELEMAAILKLANEGAYQQAATRCHEVLKRVGPSAQGYYLLGVVDSARGDDQAASEWLRRALYLDPGHEEARLLSSLLRPKL